MLYPEGVQLDEGPACLPDVIYRATALYKNQKLPSILYRESSKNIKQLYPATLGVKSSIFSLVSINQDNFSFFLWKVITQKGVARGRGTFLTRLGSLGTA